MGYSDGQVIDLREQAAAIVARLEWLPVSLAQAAESAVSKKATEHLTQGAGRRARVIRRAIQNIFHALPVDAKRPFATDAITDAQINLHALHANTFGFFDNCAWAFVYEHQLKDLITDRRKVGFFQKSLIPYLPAHLKETVEKYRPWFDRYLKDYRDALAHRIPAYIPPSEMSREEGARYSELEAAKVDSLRRRRLDEFERLISEQSSIGRPSFVFIHSYSDDESQPAPLLLHPQAVTDGLTVLEFSQEFLDHWRQRSQS